MAAGRFLTLEGIDGSMIVVVLLVVAAIALLQVVPRVVTPIHAQRGL